ncbi:hypothetical protein N7G274_009415 [Stereocaulon virgatum]|uniref:RING-type domain-containing protein n=1 Tax=Stereocaulon virgatum TaxID=373712 RepID=A0ABR3ZWF3_9LECA
MARISSHPKANPIASYALLERAKTRNKGFRPSTSASGKRFHHWLLGHEAVPHNEHCVEGQACPLFADYSFLHYPVPVYEDEISYIDIPLLHLFVDSSHAPSGTDDRPRAALIAIPVLNPSRTMAALRNLVETFLHWQEENQQSLSLQHAVRQAANVLNLETQEPKPPQTPTAIAFLFSLPLLLPQDLLPDQLECSICASPMHAESDWTDDHRLEVATCIPQCGHVIGYRCLEAWLNPMQGGSNNTCPYCRGVLFEGMAGEDNIQGLEDRLGVLEWGLRRYMRGPNAVEKAQLEWYRMRIAGYWLDKALVEIECEKAELEREIEERVRAEPMVVSKVFKEKLMKFDVRKRLVEVIELQVRYRQVSMETEWCEEMLGEVGEMMMMMEAVDVGGVDDGVQGENVNGWQTEVEVDEIEEGEIVEEEEEKAQMKELEVQH